ncbi:hypothetical protein StoSoilB3_42690 (plasmid) [Arthrobacter sp. StoSoilB3]|nr:hypothetical protein StoSoilB3_42690 [Arthrobacter sp. StoSoilB3]
MIGQIPQSELSWAKALEKMTEETGFLFVLVLPPAIGIALVRGISLILLRSQLAADYLAHKELKVSEADLAGFRTPVDKLGWHAFFQLTGVSFGLTLLPAGGAGLAANRPSLDSMPMWAFLAFVIGTVLLTWLGSLLFATVKDRIAVEWRHPRPGQRRSGPPTSSAPIGPRKHIRSYKNREKDRTQV